MKKIANSYHKHSHLENISGDYQYTALRHGSPIQKQWHKNRHNLIYFLKFLNKKDKLLDAGCGSGNVIFEFASQVKSITGIDNNRACIAFIKRQLQKKKIKNTLVKKMDILNIGLRQKHTKVIMTEVIEHFDKKDTKKLLSEVRRVMNRKGKILITTPNYQSLWIILEKMIDIFKLTPALWGEQHLIKFTPQVLAKIVESEGFAVEKVGTLNFLSPFLAVISPQLADKVADFEFKHLSFGSLIYIVASKK